MFKRFFAALVSLTASAEALAESFREANDRFRNNLGLDDTPPALEDREPAPRKRVK
jgi:hypothetical protein